MHLYLNLCLDTSHLTFLSVHSRYRDFTNAVFSDFCKKVYGRKGYFWKSLVRTESEWTEIHSPEFKHDSSSQFLPFQYDLFVCVFVLTENVMEQNMKVHNRKSGTNGLRDYCYWLEQWRRFPIGKLLLFQLMMMRKGLFLPHKCEFFKHWRFSPFTLIQCFSAFSSSDMWQLSE